ncbi:MAG: glycosyltransferase family 2 protein [Cyanobacteria bacterium CRU_2_1]|nr:glycosyltransferase family 2 protein [Cyanobacteria bacterium CRU_2_1]
MLVNSALILLTTITLLAIAFFLAIPISVLLIECLAALLPSRKPTDSPDPPTPKLAVLMPAHNEALGIRPVLEAILPQLSDLDRLVVVADNCTDETATIARSTGAIVTERQDSVRRGKGYALDYGVRFLAADPPDVVVIVDADCLVEQGTLDRVARKAVTTGRPIQSLYLMEQPANPQPKDAVSALAFMVKNLVRPRGLEYLGMPCPLTGTGMAFPWAILQKASLASGNIVEDMQLGIDLAIAGTPPAFCSESKVIGLLPQQEQAAKSQRTRWEHGHLQTLLTQVPKLLKASIQQRRLDLLAIALDFSIPPLSLLVMIWLTMMGLAITARFLEVSALPMLIFTGEGILMAIAILSAWAKFGRAELPAKTLLAIPFYLLWKIPLYLAFIVKPQTKWVRTERDAVNAPPS